MSDHTLSVDLFGASADVAHGSALAKAWDYPPFSVLNARDGWWQDRKRAWLGLGIESELGRGGDLIRNGGGCGNPDKVDSLGATVRK